MYSGWVVCCGRGTTRVLHHKTMRDVRDSRVGPCQCVEPHASRYRHNCQCRITCKARPYSRQTDGQRNDWNTPLYTFIHHVTKLHGWWGKTTGQTSCQSVPQQYNCRFACVDTRLAVSHVASTACSDANQGWHNNRVHHAHVRTWTMTEG